MDRSAAGERRFKLLRWAKYIGLALVPVALLWPLRARMDQRRRTLVHSDGVAGIAFTNDSRTLLTATIGWNVHYWDVASGRMSRTLRANSSLSAIKVSSSNRYFVTASTRPVECWDIKTGARISIVDDPRYQGYVMNFFPLRDGRVLVCNSDVRISGGAFTMEKFHLWDARTGRLWQDIPQLEHETVRAVAMTSDNSLFAYGNADGIVHLWDTRSRRLIRSLTAMPQYRERYRVKEVSDVAFSPRDAILAVSGGNEILLFDYQSGQLLKTLTSDNLTWKPQLSFSHNGDLIACIDSFRTIRVWNVQSGQLLTSFATNSVSNTENLIFSPDDSCLASADGGAVRIWDVPSS